MTPRYYLLRLVRYGPLVPARLQYLNHEPGELDNHRDRWPAMLCVVDIAGENRPPEELLERFHWRPGHWKYAQPITEAEYRYRLELLRWAETGSPDDPILRPRRRADPRQAPLPNFDKENARVG